MGIGRNVSTYNIGIQSANDALADALIARNAMHKDRKGDLARMEEMYDAQREHNEKMIDIGGPADWQKIQQNRSAINSGITGLFDQFIAGRQEQADRKLWLDHQRSSEQRMAGLLQDQIKQSMEATYVPQKSASFNDSNYKQAELDAFSAAAKYREDGDFDAYMRSIGVY